MAIDFSIVHQNPAVDRNGIHFAQITNIHREIIEGYSRPRILIQLKIALMPRYAHDVFSTVIGETSDCDYLYRRFLQSFHLTDRKLATQPADAQGYVFFGRMEHDGTAYSLLDFGSRSFLDRRLSTAYNIEYLKRYMDANCSNA